MKKQKNRRALRMKRKRHRYETGKAVVIGLFCIALIFNAGCAKQTENTAESSKELQKIIIGSDDYPPFNYADENGSPTGIDVDLATEAFERIGYKAVFTRINWEDKKKLVESGDIDCIWGSFSMDGRENDYKWAGPYMISRQVVAVESNSDIYTLADLKDKRIAVQSTTKPEELFCGHTDSRIPEVSEVFSLQNRELIYPFLSKGYVDAVAAHETAIFQYMKDYDLEYRVLEEPLFTVGLGVAFGKNDDRGIDKELTETFREMRADGSAEEIIGRYLAHAETYLEVDDYE